MHLPDICQASSEHIHQAGLGSDKIAQWPQVYSQRWGCTCVYSPQTELHIKKILVFPWITVVKAPTTKAEKQSSISSPSAYWGIHSSPPTSYPLGYRGKELLFEAVSQAKNKNLYFVSQKEHQQKNEWLLMALVQNWESCSCFLPAGLTLYFYTVTAWNHWRSPGSRSIQYHSFPTKKCFHHHAMQRDLPAQLSLIYFPVVANTE